MKILIADDHEIVRTGLKHLIESHKSVDKVYEAADGKEALKLIETHKSELDMVVLDISMPNMSGLDVLNEIKRNNSGLKILVLSMHPEKEYALRTIKSGADGYITKDSAAEELHEAITTVLKGDKYVSKKLRKIILDKYKTGSSGLPHEQLSDRELKVFLLLAEGKTIQQIADVLFISGKTVSTYKSRLQRKMNLHSISELTRYAIRHKLIE